LIVKYSTKQYIIFYRVNSCDGDYGSESDPDPFPIQDNLQIEGNSSGDIHVFICDIESNTILINNSSKDTESGWSASSGVVFDLTKNHYRTEGWTSADASVMVILDNLVGYGEALSGNIDYPIRFTLSKSHVFNGYTHPATHKVNVTGLMG
jgi:hypothetical protein